MIKIFISHSSVDVKLAEAIVELLRDAIELPPEYIRCTSVDGYRLPAGANTEYTLKQEVNSSEVFIALLSEASLKSIYVIFELGARWASGKKLFPLLSPKLTPADVKGPITSLNCLSCASAAQLHQLVSEISNDLKLKVNSPAIYQRKLDNIVQYNEMTSMNSEKKEMDDNNKSDKSGTNRTHSKNNKLEVEPEVVKTIKENAKMAYPGDYSTQQYVVKEQIIAFRAVNSLLDADIPIDILDSIKYDAAIAYPSDYSTQLYVIREQIKAWKNLQ